MASAVQQAMAVLRADPELAAELKFVQERMGYDSRGIPFNASRMTQLLSEDKGWSPVSAASTDYDPVSNRVLQANYLANSWHSNPVSRNIINNYTFFTFGSGFTVTFEDPKTQDRFNEWQEETEFLELQEKLIRERFLFGFAMAVMYPLSTGAKPGQKRAKQAEQVRYIPDARLEEILVSQSDYTQVLGYKVEGFDQPLLPQDVITFSTPTVGTSQRGASVLSPGLEYLVFLPKFAQSRFYLNQTRARLPVVRKVKNQRAATKAKTTFETTNLPPHGAVVVEGMDSEWQYPELKINASGSYDDFRILVLLCAAAVSLPEYLLVQDASNNNYASILVADSPCHQMFRSYQRKDARRFRLLLKAAGFEGALVEPPSVIPRDYEKEAKGYQISKGSGFVSAQTASESLGHDWKTETERMSQDEPQEPPFPPVDQVPDDDGEEA